MKRQNLILGLGLTGIGIVLPVSSASALTFTNANSAGPLTSLTVHIGQGFQPSVQGNAGTGSPPPSGNVFLTGFSFAPANSASGIALGTLYIFSQPYTDTAANLSTTTTNLVGTSNGSSAGFYTFAGSGITLDVNTTYYAYEDTLGQFGIGLSNPYGNTTSQAAFGDGGVTNFGLNPTVDANFTAVYSDISVPFNFNPAEGLVIGVPLFMAVRLLKNRKALKVK